MCMWIWAIFVPGKKNNPTGIGSLFGLFEQPYTATKKRIFLTAADDGGINPRAGLRPDFALLRPPSSKVGQLAQLVEQVIFKQTSYRGRRKTSAYLSKDNKWIGGY